MELYNTSFVLLALAVCLTLIMFSITHTVNFWGNKKCWRKSAPTAFLISIIVYFVDSEKFGLNALFNLIICIVCSAIVSYLFMLMFEKED